MFVGHREVFPHLHRIVHLLQPLPTRYKQVGHLTDCLFHAVIIFLQHVHSNYGIDLFQALISAAAGVTGARDLASPSLRVIADHIRACAFLIVDGVIPSNEGRGYVLRRIIRRAIRHGYQLGQKGPFFHLLVPELSRQMGDAYPELPLKQDYVVRVLRTVPEDRPLVWDLVEDRLK